MVGINLLFLVSITIHWLQRYSLSDAANISVYRSISPIEKTKQLRIEVFNACGEKDIARMITDYLRTNNVDVVFYGNHLVNNEIYAIQKTLVIDRKNRLMKDAKRIANLLDVNEKFVIYQVSPEREVDVTILIGKDYQSLKVFQ